MKSAQLSAERFDENGACLLRGVFSQEDVQRLLSSLDSALSRGAGARTQEGSVYAARDVLSLWPGAAEAWRAPALVAFLRGLLGPGFGLVRVLYFDKPPERSWSLPWHKDLTIAVAEHLPSQVFSKPTFKEGSPHVEAPQSTLEQMATARIHLDDITESNGPLSILPGSHRTGKSLKTDGEPATVLSDAGDVFAMRPLLAHCSKRSLPGASHRRILHFEFSASAELPDCFRWRRFFPA